MLGIMAALMCTLIPLRQCAMKDAVCQYRTTVRFRVRFAIFLRPGDAWHAIFGLTVCQDRF
jgi:hypothetical protein